MIYTAKVELDIDIEFFEKNKITEDEKEEINDILTETLSDNSLEIIQNIFKEMKTRTNVKLEHAFTFNERIED